MSTAIRFFGGNIGGSDYKNAMFRVGGTTYLPFLNKNQADTQYELYYDTHSSEDQIYYNQYVMPVRGVPVGAKKGSNVLVINAEFRLPFLIYYFPAIGSLGKINGVFFTDLAATWNEDFPSFNDPNQWDEDLEYSNGYNLYEDYRTGNLNRRTKTDGWVWTFGFGPRFIFFGMPWQIDFAWQYNPITKDFSSRRWYASLGLDF